MVQKSEWLLNKSEVSSEHGVVATMYPQASEAGVAMLAKGGNAIDAAIAAGFAIGVVEPFNSGLGGIAVLVYHDNASGESHIIDGTGALPAATKPDQFKIAKGGKLAGIYSWPEVEDDANQTGYRSAAVPGMPACLCAAHDMFGSLPRADVMEPAIQYAQNGYPVDWYVSICMAINQDRMNAFPESMRTFYREGGYCYRPPSLSTGADVFAQPDLARTLRDIAQGGADAFYRGRFAEMIDKDMRKNGGLVTFDDMAAYTPRISKGGIRGNYRGYEVVGGMENTGFPTVLEALKLLEGFDLAALGAGSVDELHLIAEAQRLAFIDRFAHLADASSIDIPVDGLLSDSYIAERRASIDPRRADLDAIAGNPWSHSRMNPADRRDASVTNEGLTTHLTVIDSQRNMVSLVSTLGLHFGSCVVVPETGVVLNDGTMWFDPVPGRINSMEPGRRIMTAGAPTIILRDGRPVMTIGAPGGRRVISSLIHSIVNVLDHGMRPQAAVTTPRLHCEGGQTLVDSRVGTQVVEELEGLGHDVVPLQENFSSSYFGRPNAISVDEKAGLLFGGVNQYKPAQAIGL